MDTMRDSYGQHVIRLQTALLEAASAVGFERLVLDSGVDELVSRFDDRTHPFTPTPAFAHLIALREPGCAIVLRDGERPRLHRATHESYWEAPPPAPPDWMLEPFEITSADPDLGGGRTALISNAPDRALAWDADAVNPPELLARLDAIRAKKSAYEVECIALANVRATRGHVALAEAFARESASELELHLRYLAVTGQDTSDTPYGNIVAFGRNAAVLHHFRYSRERSPASEASSMLVDAGAQVHGYAADVTRTHVREGSGANGSAARFGELIAAVDAFQQTLCDEVAPGLSFEVLHDRTHELLAEAVRTLGIASASVEELVASGFTRALFPHGLGHSLGIQVHDVGCKIKPPADRNPALRNTAEIEVGHVFTVEPGCYFIDSLLDPLRSAAVASQVDWALVDALRPFGGVRIEDNIAVLPADDGSGAARHRNLTRESWPR